MRGMNHPRPAVLEAFLRGELARAETADVVRHLLTGCPECIAGTRRMWQLGERSRALEVLLGEMLALERAGDGRRRLRASLW